MYLPWDIFLVISPAVALLFHLYTEDKNRHKSYGSRIRVFLLGVTTAIPAVLMESWLDRVVMAGRFAHHLRAVPLGGVVEPTSLLDALLMGFVGSAAIEELIKIYYLAYIKQMKVVNSRTAILIYALILGLGFACIENISYVLNFRAVQPDIAMLRTFMSLPLHGACAIFMGFFVAEAEFSPKVDKAWAYVKAWAIATLLHGTYNTLLFSQLPLAGLVTIVILVASVGIASLLFRQVYREEHPVDTQSQVQPVKSSLGQKTNHAGDRPQPTSPQPTSSFSGQAETSNQSPSPSPAEISEKITQLMNRSLQPKGITAKAVLTGHDLEVSLRATTVPSPSLVKGVQRGLMKLEINQIHRVKVYSQQFGVAEPAWSQEFELVLPEKSTPVTTNSSPTKATIRQESPSPVQLNVPVASPPPAKKPVTLSKPPKPPSFSVMAILMGWLVDLLSTDVLFLGLALVVPDFSWLTGAIVGLACTALGGFVTAYLSRGLVFRHAFSMGILTLLYGYFSAPPSLNESTVEIVTMFSLTIPAALLGGYLHWSIQQLGKFRREQLSNRSIVSF